MGRRREFDEQQALEAALKMFWRQGFEATSMRDLLEVMALSKSSFYEAFESKEALFERCLALYADQRVSMMLATLEAATSGLGFIRQMLEGVADDTQGPDSRRGCLVMNTANEFAQRHPSLASRVSDSTERFEAVFYKALLQAQEEGEWISEQHPRTVAAYLVCTLSGLRIMAKAGASRPAIIDMAGVALRALA